MFEVLSYCDFKGGMVRLFFNENEDVLYMVDVKNNRTVAYQGLNWISNIVNLLVTDACKLHYVNSIVLPSLMGELFICSKSDLSRKDRYAEVQRMLIYFS